MKPKAPCLQQGCAVLVDRGRCAAHTKTHNALVTANRDDTNAWYRTARWKKFRHWFLRYNVICQLMVDGVQCEQFATLIHHRKSPREYPDLFCDVDNTVGLCAAHHHPHEGDYGDEVYAPTKG
jgi:hypothetical protein